MERPRIVKERIQDLADALTPAERQLSDSLLSDYPMAGLQSITRVANAAGVSTPTVIRLARKLGFDGFPEMQSALREEASAQIRSPIVKRDAWAGETEGASFFHSYASATFANLRDTIDRLNPETFDAIAARLSDRKTVLYLAGGRITRSNADYLFNHLQIIRPAVTLMDNSPNVWPQYLLDMDERATLILFDIRRYENDLVRLAKQAKEQGATLVLFTDQWGSPISRVADHVINASVEVPSSWDSTLAINLVAEALLAEVQNRMWDDARDRIERLEDMFRATRLFRK